MDSAQKTRAAGELPCMQAAEMGRTEHDWARSPLCPLWAYLDCAEARASGELPQVQAAEMGRSGVVEKRLTILACVVAFGFKLALALTTYGSNDVLFWEANLRKIQTDGGIALYHDGAVPVWQGKQYRVERFSQPPFMVHVLKVWGAASWLPLRVWLRVTSALADVAMIWLAWLILRAEKIGIRPWLLVLLAVSPVSILVSGFHGNTDPVMIAFVLLSIYLLVTRHPAWLAGIAFGMALNIKVVPVIFLPALLLYLDATRGRVLFASSAVAVFLAGSAPYLFQNPAPIAHSVFGYIPVLGSWGFAELAYLFSPPALAGYRAVGRFLALGTVLGAAAWVCRHGSQNRLFQHCGLAALMFLFFSPGFGPQYLAWVMPWIAVLPWKRASALYFASAAFVIAFYGVWSRGGWYLANMLEYSPVPAGVVIASLLEMVCWFSVGAAAAALLRLGAVAQESGPSTRWVNSVLVQTQSILRT